MGDAKISRYLVAQRTEAAWLPSESGRHTRSVPASPTSYYSYMAVQQPPLDCFVAYGSSSRGILPQTDGTM